jgi:hypothetical protein
MTVMRERISAVLGGTLDYEDGLDALTVAPAADVDSALLAILQETCTRLWRRGWQPVELHRVVARRHQPPVADLVRDVVAAHLRRFPAGAVDPRWQAQADTLDARVWWTSDAAYLTEVARRYRLDRTAVVDLMLTLLAVLVALPGIEVLVPPPGAAPAAPESRGTTDPALLHRVRALLAKAESTEFPAEAETYTAKAQELVSRHSIDEALLAARDGGPEVVPFARRVGIDHPYESEKASLLHAVAAANRCHTVWSSELGFSTVFGFDGDLDVVEVLFASLSVQANRAMARTEPPGGKAARARLRTFRRSFLVAFTVRVSERLVRSDAAVRTGADSDRLLPVLAARDEQVQETMQRVFPHTVRARGSRVDSAEGWDRGRAAADRAGLRPS